MRAVQEGVIKPMSKRTSKRTKITASELEYVCQLLTRVAVEILAKILEAVLALLVQPKQPTRTEAFGYMPIVIMQPPGTF